MMSHNAGRATMLAIAVAIAGRGAAMTHRAVPPPDASPDSRPDSRPDAFPLVPSEFAPVTMALDVNLGAMQDAEVMDGANGGPASGAWEVRFSPSLWLVGIDGDVGARGFDASVSADFGEIADASDSILAISGRLEVWKGPVGAYVDGLYAELGVDDQRGKLGLGSVDVTLDLTLIDFGVLCRIGEWPVDDADVARGSVTLDVYAGARFTDLEIEIDPELPAARRSGRDWFDPIVGAKATIPLTPTVGLVAWGDVGGFGVESDFAWSATVVFAFDITLFDHPARLYAGYRGLGQDFEEGSGADRFRWDVIIHGPILGMSLTF